MAPGPSVAIADRQAATYLLSTKASSSMPTGRTLSTSAVIVEAPPSGVPSGWRHPDANATPVGNWPAAPAIQNHDLGDTDGQYTGNSPAIQVHAQTGFAPQSGGPNVLAAAASACVALPATESYGLASMEGEYTGYSPAIEWSAQSGFVPQIGVPNVAAVATPDAVASCWEMDVPPHGRNAVSHVACALQSSPMPAGWPTAPAPDMVAKDTLFPPSHKVKVLIPKTSLEPFALPAVVWPPLPQLLPVEMDWEPTHAIYLPVPGAAPSTGSVQVASAQATQTAVLAVAVLPSPVTSGVVTGREVQPLQPALAIVAPQAPRRQPNRSRETGMMRDSISTSNSMGMRPSQPPTCRGGQGRRWANFADVREPTLSARPEERIPGYQHPLVSNQPPPAPTPPLSTRPALTPFKPIWGPNQIRMLKVGVVCYGLLLGASYFGLI